MHVAKNTLLKQNQAKFSNTVMLVLLSNLKKTIYLKYIRNIDCT
jgi:hypothetical protein